MRQIADTLSDSLLTELSRSKRVSAMGPGDLTSVLGLERQKQLMGCDEGSSTCLSEITAALGAPWLLTGSVLRMGKTMRVDLKLVRTKDGLVTWRDGKTMKDESEFFDVIVELVKNLVSSTDFGATSGSSTSASVSAAGPSGPSKPVAPWLVVGAGGVLLVAGAIFTGFAGSEWGNVQARPARDRIGRGGRWAHLGDRHRP